MLRESTDGGFEAFKSLGHLTSLIDSPIVVTFFCTIWGYYSADLPEKNQDGVRFGDNDNLAALTAVQLEAEGVFLFTDVDYLYTANPNVDPAAEPMKAAA